METDHIVPVAEGGTGEIENAIPVCFECHAEIHSYNDKHPRGRKFTPRELREHKRQWLRICADSPQALLEASFSTDVGPLQALVDELEFNMKAGERQSSNHPNAMFLDEQFRRAISCGSISILNEEIKGSILAAYVAGREANQMISSCLNTPPGTSLWKPSTSHGAVGMAATAMEQAHRKLIEFLTSESNGSG